MMKCEILKKTKYFFEEQKFCDVVIASKDNFRLSAHKIILSAASKYFLGLLRNPEVEELIIADVDGETLKLLLNFIYTASIEISRERVFDIMHGAFLLELDTVHAECSDFIFKSLDTKTCLSVSAICLKNNHNDLLERSLMYAAHHFVNLVHEEEYLLSDVEFLVKLLKRNDLTVGSEEDVFYGIIRWIEHDKPNREMHCQELLSHLRFPLLTPNFIVNQVSDNFPSPECQSVIMKALKWHFSTENRNHSLFEGKLCKPRNQKKAIIVIKGSTTIDAPVFAEILDPLTGVWSREEWPERPQNGWYTNGININEKVYLACTVIQGTFEASIIHCFNLVTKQWTELPPMLKQRFLFGMAELNGELYIVGGNNVHSEILKSVEKWDPSSSQGWQMIAPMISECDRPGVVAFNGLLYVIGSGPDNDFSIFEFYDPQTNTWAQLESPIQRRTTTTLCVVKQMLYAVGGWTSGGICTIVERYNFETNTWTEISPSGMFNQYIHCISYMNRLLVLAKSTEQNREQIIEEYNPETGKWRDFKSLGRDHRSAILISK